MRFVEVVLQSTHLGLQKDFYHSRLGLPIVEESGTRLGFQVGKTRLVFQQVPSNNPNHVYHLAFNVPENQIGSALRWVSQRATILDNPDEPSNPIFDFKEWNAHAFYFVDAENNILEMIARHNLKNGNQTLFSVDHILGVSEIGLPTPDVIGTVDIFAMALGAPIYSGAGSDLFTAVGDEEGLLITVKNDHLWMPTKDRRAQPLPLALTIEDIDDDFSLDALPYQFVKP